MENSQINSQSGSVSQEVRDLKKICIVLAAVAAIALSTVFAAVYVICHLQAEDPGSDGAVTWNDSAATSAPALAPQGAYPFTSLRKITYDDIAYLSSASLRIMRNEIYARHGYIFDSEDLRRYFQRQSWYTPVSKTVNLTAIEKYNVEFIKQYE